MTPHISFVFKLLSNEVNTICVRHVFIYAFKNETDYFSMMPKHKLLGQQSSGKGTRCKEQIIC